MHKWICILLCLLSLTTFASKANTLVSFDAIQINPADTYNYRAIAHVYVRFNLDLVTLEEKVLVREAIAIALKSLNLKNFIGVESIKTAKEQITSYINENHVIAGNKIQQVFITDLVIEYTGENRAFVVQPKR